MILVGVEHLYPVSSFVAMDVGNLISWCNIAFTFILFFTLATFTFTFRPAG